MAQQTEEHHLINGSWYLVEHENLEKILLSIGKSFCRLQQLPDYVPVHLSLAQPHEQKSFSHS